MQTLLALLVVGASAVAAFSPAGPAFTGKRLPCRAFARSHSVGVRMGKSFEQKEQIVDTVRTRLETAQLVFSTSLNSINMPQINMLRGALPEGTNAMVIKNRLLKRATRGTPWVAADSLAVQSNLWVICDEDLKNSIKALKDWGKATKKGDVIAGGVLEGRLYDSAGVYAIGDLPTKSELYAQIAGSIAAIPTGLARTVKEIPQKTARAIKLAFVPDA